MYADRPMREYLADLGAKMAAPGGGSAAALAAAIGANLMSMVANFTIGKPAYRQAEAKVTAILEKTRKYADQLLGLVDADVEAFEKLSAGLKARGLDETAADELYKAAIEPPFLVCEIAHNCLAMCDELASLGNTGLVTDTAIAAIMLEGAFMSAKFNVYINLERVKDTDYIAKIHRVLHPLEDAMPKLREEVVEKCEDIVAGRGQGARG
jgi:formiminotetrahydrofolate cyclodeaminase